MSIWTPAPTGRAISRPRASRRGAGARPAAWRILLAPLAVAVAVTACAGRSEKPPALAPQTVSPVADPERGRPTEAEPEPPPTPARPASAIEKTIVIDEGGESGDGPSLVEAAEAERERRSQSAGPTVVINDENLKSQAVGQLTVATPAPRPEDEADAASPTEPPPGDSPAAEDFWRRRILEARQAWRELVDEIDDLESEVNLLRRRFYDEDDPYYRDSQIKPAWDRALDRLRVARELADEAEQLVVETLEDGRRAGALPGWLREGLELERVPGRNGEARPSRLEEYEPGEPQIYDPDDDGDGGR